MKYLSRDDIERIAQRVLRAYYKLPKLRGEPITSIQPEVLAVDLLGLTVEYHVLSRSGYLLGATALGEIGLKTYDEDADGELRFLDGKTLFVDKYLAEDADRVGRFHFSLTHEASHQILWMLFPPSESEYAARRVHYYAMNRSPQDWEEWRADALTAAILMPPDLVCAKMIEYGLGTKIKMLNRVYAAKVYSRFSEMASSMGVSKTALSIRMQQLGLLDREYLKDPYEFVNVHVSDDEIGNPYC